MARLCLQIVKIGNRNAVTDAASAALNVRINAVGVKDRPLAESWLAELDSIEGEVSALARITAEMAAKRGAF